MEHNPDMSSTGYRCFLSAWWNSLRSRHDCRWGACLPLTTPYKSRDCVLCYQRRSPRAPVERACSHSGRARTLGRSCPLFEKRSVPFGFKHSLHPVASFQPWPHLSIIPVHLIFFASCIRVMALHCSFCMDSQCLSHL